MLLDRGNAPLTGLRLLLSKRPELLPSRHYCDRREITVFDYFCRYELLLPFLDLLEEVYGQLFTFHYLNMHLGTAREHYYSLESYGGAAFWRSVFCHPLADLVMLSDEHYLDRQSGYPATLRELLEVGVIYDRGILVYTPCK